MPAPGLSEAGARIALSLQKDMLRVLEGAITTYSRRAVGQDSVRRSQRDADEFKEIIKSYESGHDLHGFKWRDFTRMSAEQAEAVFSRVTFSDQFALRRLFEDRE